MRTTAGCRLELDVEETTEVVLSIAAAAPATSEHLTVEVDGSAVQVRELQAHHGTRLHLATLPAGRAVVGYDVQADPTKGAREVNDLDAIVALRPSRYCPSDLLGPWVISELGVPAATVQHTVERVVSWVRRRLVYDGTASRPVDSAVDTLLTGKGVCRDYAHLVVTLLRALDVPARLVSAYAPGLSPMDFHAVAEVAVDGYWQVHDATGLAPRPSLLRIATGRDAADTAFLTLTGGAATLVSTEVWASTDGDLPRDAPVHLA
jgi:transglutaminase-like putative cysteine protease